MILSFRTTFFEPPKTGWASDHSSQPGKKSAFTWRTSYEARNRLLFRLPKSLLLPGAHASSTDCGRAWCRGRLSSISYSRTHEDCRQPADDDRMQEQEQIRGRGSATVDRAL